MKDEGQWLTARKARETVGMSASTLRRWSATGKIESTVGPSGQRFYNLSKITDGRELAPKQRIIYARVSSPKQRDDLARQIDHMEQAYPGRRVIKDVGSGINFKRPGFVALLDLANNGEIESVAISHRDRLCRFAFDLIEHIFRRNGVEILVHEQAFASPSAELAEDLMSIVQVFCCRRNGARRFGGKRLTHIDKDENGQAQADPRAEAALGAVA